MKPEQPASVIFSGTFERSLDSKNRVTIPAAWISGMGAEFQVVPNPKPEEPFLIVMLPEEFSKMEERIMSLDQPAAMKRQAVRAFYSAARAVTMDKQGRILLPEDYCRKTHLSGEVNLIGGKSRFEIWSRDRWQKASEDMLPEYEKIADLIGL